jgi:aspartate racemase
MQKRIGLLGGIGPEATGTFYLLLIRKLQESGKIKSNSDFPQFIINSIPAPELVFQNVTEKQLEPYIQGLKELEGAKVDFIAMVCNTIHSYYDILQKSVNVPLIDLKSEFKKFILKKKLGTITILATPSTINSGLFKVEKIKYLDLSATEQESLSNAIFNFNSGAERQKQIKIVEEIANKKIREGAELVVLGCTEISMMLQDANISKIDTLEILADAVLSRADKN